MSKFIAVGFDREADADKFKLLVGNQMNVIKLAVPSVDELTGTKKTLIHNLRVRSIHDHRLRGSDRRQYLYSGVVIEFQQGFDAAVFAAAILNIAQGNSFPENVQTILSLLTPDKVAGIRLEKE